MNTPSEELLADAVDLLGGASNPRAIANAATALTEAMGLQRYVILDIESTMGGPLVRALYHNAPDLLRTEAEDLAVLACDPVMARALASRVPFTWQASGGGPWRDKHASLGYRCGVAAPSWNGDMTGSIVILSCDDEQIDDQQVYTLQTYALMAAVMVASTFQRLDAAGSAASPLTPRELDCLLYVLVGKSAKETARALGIEPRTVMQYLERARAKMGTANSYAAATQALHFGWLDLRAALELGGLAPSGAGVVGMAAGK